MDQVLMRRSRTATADDPGRDVIHLNAAGAALPAPGVTRGIVDHLHLEERIGSHWAAAQVQNRLLRARSRAATLLGCRDHNVAFGETAGRLWANAFASAFGRWRKQPCGRVLVARNEWPGNILNLMRTLDGEGFRIEVVANDAQGRIDLDDLRARIDDDVVAVCVPACGSHSGILQPLDAVAAIPRSDRCLLFVDAAQALGQVALPMNPWGIDVLVAPARKWLRGPRGQAVMGVSDRALAFMERPVILDRAGFRVSASSGCEMREDAGRFEAFEFSVAGRLGFAAALDHYLDGEADIVQRTVLGHLGTLYAGLATISGLRVYERLQDGPVFATFSTEGVTAEEIVEGCRAARIVISTVGEKAAIGPLPAQDIRCRVAPHAYNTSNQVLRLVDVIGEIVRTRRNARIRGSDRAQTPYRNLIRQE